MLVPRPQEDRLEDPLVFLLGLEDQAIIEGFLMLNLVVGLVEYRFELAYLDI